VIRERSQHRESLALALEQARLARAPIEPVSASEGGLDLAGAYAISQLGIARRIENGSAVVGHKIGLTSPVVQQQLGIDRPDYGTLLDEMQLGRGGVVPRELLIQPRVELELAFRLARTLAGPGITDKHVSAATATVQPAIEIVDSRIANWRIGLLDTIADNASSGAFVLGGAPRPLSDVDIASVAVELRRNDEVVARGSSDAVLGDPRKAVAWLANELATHGTALQAGHVVLSGACTAMVDARPGDRFVGDFGRLGRVEVAFA
jgi:2-keto-4-pentenoate hydratase